MAKVPQDVNELMWLVAESNDPQSIREFGNRFPELRNELLERIQVVNELKGAKENVTPNPAVFKRSKHTPAPRKSISLALIFELVIAFALLVTIGIWLFGQTRRESNTPGQVTAPPVAHSENQSGQEPPSSTSNIQGSQIGTPNQTSLNPNPGPVTQPNQQSSNPNPPSTTGTEQGGQSQLTSLKLDNSPLFMALQILTLQGKIKLKMAPGLKNVNVTINESQVPPEQILQDLGAEAGFKVVPQGDSSYLLVPTNSLPANSGTSAQLPVAKP